MLETLSPIMWEFALCSGLTLNMAKTVLIPLWEGDPELFRNRLMAKAPGWGAAPLRHSAKYLGFILGPASGKDSHNEPLAKYRARLEAWRNTEGGTFMSIMAYRTYILTVLTFVAQLANAPGDESERE